MPFGHPNGGWYQPLNPNEHIYTEGYGFSSNQSMSVWEIKNTKGIYTIEE